MLRCVDLLDSHAEISARLRAHLLAVVSGDASAAQAAFLRFAALLKAHWRSEDEVLLPAFERLELGSNGCNRDLLSKEHRKLERLLAAAEERVLAESVTLDPPTRLHWVEDSRMLKEVLEHHDVRERAGFHPALDGALDQVEAAALAATARSVEQALETQELEAYGLPPSL